MKHLLLVDDSPDILDSLSFGLEGSYRITTAENGQEALDACLGCTFDLVILDLMMPVMDGGTFLQELQARGLRVPVIVASARLGLATLAPQLGAAEWVQKPFDLDVLEAKIERVLQGGGGGGSHQGPGGSTPPPGRPDGSSQGASARPFRRPPVWPVLPPAWARCAAGLSG